MKAEGIKIFPIGDSALTVEFGTFISSDLNDRAIALSEHFETTGFPGFVETVPAYASLSIFYDPIVVKRSFPQFRTSFEAVRHLALSAAMEIATGTSSKRQIVEIPVNFTCSEGPDLELVAAMNSITPADVIEIFTARTYRVYMLGFLPGFTYMGEVDERIATPRKDAPREMVGRGSVGIAGRQTGVYSLASPGGWQIIGRTDVEMFTPESRSPTYLHPGDEVRFVSIK